MDSQLPLSHPVLHFFRSLSASPSLVVYLPCTPSSSSLSLILRSLGGIVFPFATPSCSSFLPSFVDSLAPPKPTLAEPAFTRLLFIPLRSCVRFAFPAASLLPYDLVSRQSRSRLGLASRSCSSLSLLCSALLFSSLHSLVLTASAQALTFVRLLCPSLCHSPQSFGRAAASRGRTAKLHR